MAWNGMEWHGMAWDGMGWHGMVWDGMSAQAATVGCVKNGVSWRCTS